MMLYWGKNIIKRNRVSFKFHIIKIGNMIVRVISDQLDLQSLIPIFFKKSYKNSRTNKCVFWKLFKISEELVEFPKHKQQHNWNNYNGTTVLLIIYFLISRFKWDYLHPLTTWQLCTDVNRGVLGEMGILCGLATLTKHHILPFKDGAWISS